jgi:hypothetical protein
MYLMTGQELCDRSVNRFRDHLYHLKGSMFRLVILKSPLHVRRTRWRNHVVSEEACRMMLKLEILFEIVFLPS